MQASYTSRSTADVAVCSAVDVYEAAWIARFAALSPEDVVLGGGGSYGFIAGLKSEPFAVADDPEVQIELGAFQEGVEYALLPDHGRYRGVRVLIPVSQNLLWGDVAPPELAQAEAVRLDVGGQVSVVGDVGEFDLQFWDDAVDRESLKEATVLQLVEKVARGDG